jgi:hypothetical protein
MSETSERTILAATDRGVARATPASGPVSRPACGASWSVEWMLRGQDVRCIAADPLRPAVIYAGTQGDGAWRSADGGQTWRAVGLAGRIVKSLAVSRVEPGVVYAGLGNGDVWHSGDYGETWRQLPLNLTAIRSMVLLAP